MPNLKKFAHSLRHEMVSHLFPFLPSISKPALRLFDLIFAKTRFCSHITFLSRCLHGNVIPNGFRSSFNPLYFNLPVFNRRFSDSISVVCSSHSRRLMRMTIKSMSANIQHTDENISQYKTFLSQVCPPILTTDIIDKIRVLNSKLYLFLKDVKASKLAKLLGPRSVISPDSTSSAKGNNLVFTIPPDLHLSDPERSVLAKGLKFVPNSGPIDMFSVKEDTEAFFRRLRLKALFHNQPSTYNKDVFEEINPKKSSWSPPEGQFASLDLFVRQCRHDIDHLEHSRRKKPSNLSRDELVALKSLRSRNDVVIKPADKGGAVVVWRADLYRQEALRQLSDASFYTKTNSDSTSTHQKTVKTTINRFIQAGDLPASASNLIITTPRTPVMYFLPKIHKPDNPGRPIVSACSCPTELISSFLDNVMFPLVKALPSYIKDTKHALQIFDQIRFSGPHKFIFTMDVKSLYTVIPHRDGLEALKFFFDKRTLLEPSTATLIRLAELVLTLNNFSFDGEHYQQINGVAMGTKMGPSYANLFVGYVEKQIFEQYTGLIPDFFGRYIDDCLGTASCSRVDLETFINYVNDFHPALKFTWEISETRVSFLDISVSINGDALTTTVSYKPTDSHSYLLFSSSHPNHTKQSIPYSQFLRLRRLCSDDNDFEAKSSEMRSFFVQRGYRTHLLDTAINKAFNISRSDTLKPPTDKNSNAKIPLVLTFHPFNYKVRDTISRNFHILKNDPETSAIFTDNPLISFRRNKNIRDNLVRSTLSQNLPAAAGTFSCTRTRCYTCSFLNSTLCISGPKSDFVIRHNFSCTSSNIIYCISCSKCCKLYIGETGRRLSDRFAEHLRSVRNNDVDKPVARHFNSGNHSISDMKVCAISPISGGNDSRKRHEKRLIFEIGTIHPHGLNERFSFI